jgi:hypothetical protein
MEVDEKSRDDTMSKNSRAGPSPTPGSPVQVPRNGNGRMRARRRTDVGHRDAEETTRVGSNDLCHDELEHALLLLARQARDVVVQVEDQRVLRQDR